MQSILQSKRRATFFYLIIWGGSHLLCDTFCLRSGFLIPVEKEGEFRTEHLHVASHLPLCSLDSC
jgi:hypothetical protein